MTVRILFSSSRSIGGRLIEFTTFSDWSHVELMDDNVLLGASPFHGVTTESARARIDSSRAYAVAEVDADPLRVWTFARSQLGRPYDWHGVLGMAFRRNWSDDDSWFCSELVAAALAAAEVSVARLDVWRVTPQDLWQSDKMKVLDGSQ